MERIVLAYSGGLDTSVAVPWLAEHRHAEVITVTLDLGQGSELTDIRERALALGAVRAHVFDVREEFASEHVLPALQAGAVYEHRYPLASALARPLVAKYLVRVAEMEGADAVAHGGTGKGNDRVRIEVAVRSLGGEMEVLAPAGEWGMNRRETLAFAQARGIPVPPAAERLYNVDANLWGRAIACGVLEDDWAEPPEDAFTLTRSPLACPDIPASVEIRFERGVPVAVNGVTLPLLELIASVETIAGTHGVGRIDMIENRVVGIKSRDVYEAPAAVVLHAAHAELQSVVVERDFERLLHQVAIAYADLVYDGRWFSPMREALGALVAKVQERVTGTVRLKLCKGSCAVVGRASPFSLYDRPLATYDAGDTFDHAAAAGLAKIAGLPAAAAARRARAARGPGEARDTARTR